MLLSLSFAYIIMPFVTEFIFCCVIVKRRKRYIASKHFVICIVFWAIIEKFNNANNWNQFQSAWEETRSIWQLNIIIKINGMGCFKIDDKSPTLLHLKNFIKVTPINFFWLEYNDFFSMNWNNLSTSWKILDQQQTIQRRLIELKKLDVLLSVNDYKLTNA